jgi:uncharacterized protein (TIGR00725 family)
MASRRIIIGAIGGDKQPDPFATELGAAVARAGCILLTGGEPSTAADIKNAAMRGAVEEEANGQGAVARLIAVLPKHAAPAWQGRLPFQLALHTGLPHYVRNIINGLTPDVLVAFGGGAGTLAEVAFATAAGKTLFFHAAVQRLRTNVVTYFGQQAPEHYIETYLRTPLSIYDIADKHRTADEVHQLLTEMLERAEDAPEDADELVARCIAVVESSRLAEPAGYPGLPGDAGSKDKFRQLVEAMSRGRPPR